MFDPKVKLKMILHICEIAPSADETVSADSCRYVMQDSDTKPICGGPPRHTYP